MNWLNCWGATVGIDAWIYICSFSELKLQVPSSWGIFHGENKSFDQGTVLLQGGEEGALEIIPFCAPVGSPGATEPTPMNARSRHRLPTRFPSSLVSPVVARTHLFARTSSLEIKRIFSKFYL